MGDMSTQRHEHRDVPADTFEMRLAMARFHAGNISANEAALRVGVNGQTWRNWEAGTSPGAHQPAMLAFIAQQLGVDQDWLRNGGPLSNPDSPNSRPDADTVEYSHRRRLMLAPAA